MHEKICRRGHARGDMQSKDMQSSLLHVLSCISSPAYHLLHVLSCISSRLSSRAYPSCPSSPAYTLAYLAVHSCAYMVLCILTYAGCSDFTGKNPSPCFREKAKRVCVSEIPNDFKYFPTVYVFQLRMFSITLL